MSAKRPNILFIMADQFRSDIMSCAGGPAHTPNLDAIAQEGIRFTQCATVAPLCIPARVSLFTGKYPHTTGAWDNASFVLSPNANIWSKSFRELGYATSLFGKTHLHGSKCDFIARESYLHGYGFDTVDEITGPHASCESRTYMTDMWKEHGHFDAFVEDMHKRGKTPKAYPSPVPLEDFYDVYVGNCGVNYLKNYDGDKPWFCHVSFGGPHEPWDTPEPYNKLYDPEKMPLPDPRMQDVNPDRPRGVTDNLMEKKKIQCNVEQAKEIRADYCGACTLIDEMIGRMIDTIKARGEWDNTIVLFTSDHGELNGDQGFVNKRNFFHGALNVPMIIRTPETVGKGGMVTDAPVNLIDAGPTLVDLAGGVIDYPQFGLSLRGVIDGTNPRPRDYVLSELSGEVMYCDDEWKVVLNKNGEIYLLFDMKNDPHEQKNLAAAPGMEEISKQLICKVMQAVAVNRCLKPSVIQEYGSPDAPVDA